MANKKTACKCLCAQAQTETWRSFMKGKMGPYMKSEGSHGAAIRRMGTEWKEYKKTHGMR